MFTNDYVISELHRLAQDQLDVESEKDELLQVVDDSGEIIGGAPRSICHRMGLRHTVVYVMIVSKGGSLLIQTRGEPGKSRLDVAVGGHVAFHDPSTAQAAHREMVEELGVESDLHRLCEIAVFNRNGVVQVERPLELNNERRHLFLYEMSEDEVGELAARFNERYEKEAVRRIDWMTMDGILVAYDENKIADGLRGALVHYLRWLCSAS